MTEPHDQTPPADPIESQSLPPGWVETTLGEALKIVAGGTPSASDPANFQEEGGIAWVTPADLSGYKSMFIGRGKRNLTQKGYDSSSATLMPKGSVLFSSRAPIGYVAIAENEISTNQGFKSFVFSADVNNRFLFFYLKSIKDLAEQEATGTTFKELSGAATALLPLTLPPLAEQIRIADKLDSLLARVEAARERLERVPKLVKAFRQSVLSAAVSGELTREWRGGEDAEWEETALGDVCSLRNGFAYKSSDYQASGIPILRISDIDGTKAHPSRNVFLPEDMFEEKFAVAKGDLLIAMSGATTGKIGVYDYEYPSLQNQRVGNLKIIKPQKITSGYRDLMFRNMSDSILEQAYGGAQPNISSKDIEAQPISLPSVPEQAEIVRRVEALFALADRVEQRYAEGLRAFDLLTPALLAKAFRGELVPQDPNDEPASVLLERIQAQRESAGGKATRGAGKRGRPPKEQDATAASGEPKRRGRPPKAREVPTAMSEEDAIRLLQERGQARAEGSRQVSLFGEET